VSTNNVPAPQASTSQRSGSFDRELDEYGESFEIRYHEVQQPEESEKLGGEALQRQQSEEKASLRMEGDSSSDSMGFHDCAGAPPDYLHGTPPRHTTSAEEDSVDPVQEMLLSGSPASPKRPWALMDTSLSSGIALGVRSTMERRDRGPEAEEELEEGMLRMKLGNLQEVDEAGTEEWSQGEGSANTLSPNPKKATSILPSSSRNNSPVKVLMGSDPLRLPSTLQRFGAFLANEKTSILLRLMTTTSLNSINHENICCLNTVILILLLDHKR
jgi:hypothetical protein